MTLLKITSAQQLYVAFYGRPADVAGQNFWDTVVQENPNNFSYTAIAQAFGESAEAQARFGQLSPAEAVNTLFRTILNREADPAGQAFYVNELASGRLTLANLAIAIVEGIDANSLDAQTFRNKVRIADQFTHALNSPVKIQAYDFSTNPNALPIVQALIAQVTADDSNLPTTNQVTAIAEQIVVTSGSPAIASATAEARVVIQGGGSDASLSGSGEAVTLVGSNGNDTLQAGNGDDQLIGGLGADTLTGGAGRDRFVYAELTDSLLSGFDRITDFQIGLDYLKGPYPVSATAVKNLGTVTSLDPEAIATVLTTRDFVASGAATFQFEQRTFVALNDDVAGFQANHDAVIEITGFQGDLTSLAIT